MLREIVRGFIGRARTRTFREIPRLQLQRLWLATHRRFGQLLLPLGLLIIILAPLRIYDVNPQGIFPIKGYAYSLDLSNLDRWGTLPPSRCNRDSFFSKMGARSGLCIPCMPRSLKRAVVDSLTGGMCSIFPLPTIPIRVRMDGPTRHRTERSRVVRSTQQR